MPDAKPTKRDKVLASVIANRVIGKDLLKKFPKLLGGHKAVIATLIAADRAEERGEVAEYGGWDQIKGGIEALKQCLGEVRDSRDTAEAENSRLLKQQDDLVEALEDAQSWFATGMIDGIGFDDIQIHEAICVVLERYGFKIETGEVEQP